MLVETRTHPRISTCTRACIRARGGFVEFLVSGWSTQEEERGGERMTRVCWTEANFSSVSLFSFFGGCTVLHKGSRWERGGGTFTRGSSNCSIIETSYEFTCIITLFDTTVVEIPAFISIQVICYSKATLQDLICGEYALNRSNLLINNRHISNVVWYVQFPLAAVRRSIYKHLNYKCSTVSKNSRVSLSKFSKRIRLKKIREHLKYRNLWIPVTCVTEHVDHVTRL